MTDSNDPLHVAFHLHQAGQYAEAEQLYRQIVAAQPGQSDAWHLLGVAAHQQGRHAEAIESLSRATALQPAQPLYHFHLAGALQALQRSAEAANSYQAALRLNPQLAPAHYNLALIYQAAGELTAAAGCLENAIRLQPNFAEAHDCLGRVLQSQGKPADAEASYRAALAIDPNSVITLNNLAALLITLSRHAEAIERLVSATRLRPDMPECYLNLARAYRGQGQRDECAAHFRQALALRPDYLAARCELADVLHEQGHTAEAEAEYRETLRRHPNCFEALNNLANLLHNQGQYDEPSALYERAIALRPDFAMGRYNRAIFYSDHDRVLEAIAEYQEALRLQPDLASAYINLGLLYESTVRPDEACECATRAMALGDKSATARTALAGAMRAQGRTAEAIEWYHSALELGPDPNQHSNFLYCLNFDPRFSSQRIHEEHLAWARTYAEPLTAGAAPHLNDRSPERRLRVGYVSPHFRDHAVNYFSEPLITAHDHQRFEIFCYSASHPPDEVTARLRAAADHWRDVRKLDDERLARLVRDDQIDVLVDLTGHIGENRLLAFARKPAPVQVTYIGYQNTTGMSAMDYRLTDALADPPGQTDRYYTEKLVRLPRAFFCYQPGEAPEIMPPAFVANGYVTFGSFNHVGKVVPQVEEAWFKILARVADSRLLVLANRGGYAQQHWHELAVAHGVDPSRVVVCDKRPRLDYLRLIHAADVALDPFPFNGHTTTCDSIWMGVPVVMLQGDAYASRFGGSVLANVGLEELITRSIDEYIERAVALANDRQRLTDLRRDLRPRMAASPLLDFAGFTRNVEAAYRQMWRDWCAGR